MNPSTSCLYYQIFDQEERENLFSSNKRINKILVEKRRKGSFCLSAPGAWKIILKISTGASTHGRK